jgi:hypothetical protein
MNPHPTLKLKHHHNRHEIEAMRLGGAGQSQLLPGVEGYARHFFYGDHHTIALSMLAQRGFLQTAHEQQAIGGRIQVGFQLEATHAIACPDWKILL